jgi:hypothetical protein
MKILCSRECSILVLAGGIALFAPAAGRAGEPLHPLRAVTPPVIDGWLDDDVWRQAPTVDGFKTGLPDFGADMRERTVVSYAYDAEKAFCLWRL